MVAGVIVLGAPGSTRPVWARAPSLRVGKLAEAVPPAAPAAAVPAPAPSCRLDVESEAPLFYTKRKRRILPLPQYRRCRTAVSTKRRHPRQSPFDELPLAEDLVTDWRVHAEPVALSFADMLRGEAIPRSRQVRPFTCEPERPQTWDDRDEDVAVRSRSRAYAEAIAARAAADAEECDRRLIEERVAAARVAAQPVRRKTKAASAKKKTKPKIRPAPKKQPPRRLEEDKHVRVVEEPAQRRTTPPKKAVEEPQPRTSNLKLQHERKRQKKAKMDRFLATMSALATQNRWKRPPETRDHATTLQSHDKLMARYTASLMPSKQHPSDICETHHAQSPPKPDVDETWLADHFDRLTTN